MMNIKRRYCGGVFWREGGGDEDECVVTSRVPSPFAQPRTQAESHYFPSPRVYGVRVISITWIS